MEFSKGMNVTWLSQPRGGYSYIHPVPAVVIGHTDKRIIIAAMLVNGNTKTVRVNPNNLQPRLAPQPTGR